MDDVIHEKDLGLIIQSDLQFGTHISEKVKKANSILGLIKKFHLFRRRRVSPFIVYTTLIRRPPLRVCHLCMVTSQVGRKKIN